MPETVTTLEEVKDNIIAFNEGLGGNEGLVKYLPFFRAWYYIPGLEYVGPSKFIGYRGMTAKIYLENHTSGMSGTETEPVLRQWFDLAHERPSDREYIMNLVKELLAGYHKIPNRKARYNTLKPLYDTVHQKKQLVELEFAPKVEAKTIQVTDTQPIVEVYWQAYLTLHPQDQKDLAERIIKHLRYK